MTEPTDFPIKPDRLDIYTAHMAYPVYIDGVPLAALIEARAERDALREALRRYGQCSYSCASNVILTSLPPKRQPCDCGYRAALTANHSAPVVEG